MNKSVSETIILIIIAIAVFIGLRFSIQTYIVYGPSMEPNFHDNEWIIVNKLAYKFGEPQRGNIIVFHPPTGDTKPYIKRIIGLPGEIVEIKSGKVYIHKADGGTILLEEPYIKEAFFTNYTSKTIAANEYFVMGDNRNNSSDSRSGWFVSSDKIIGKDWVAIWPPRAWGTSSTYTQPTQAVSAVSK